MTTQLVWWCYESAGRQNAAMFSIMSEELPSRCAGHFLLFHAIYVAVDGDDVLATCTGSLAVNIATLTVNIAYTWL